MPVLSINIPKGMTAAAAKSALLAAIKAGYPLRVYPIEMLGRTVAAKIAVNGVELSAIAKQPRFQIETDAEVASRLIAQHIMSDAIPDTEVGVLGALVRAGVIVHSDLQHNVARAIRSALVGDKINIIEAPTGSGKTLAMLSVAAEMQDRVVIAVPTIDLMEQVQREWVRILATGTTKTIAFIVGRNNFVSTTALMNDIEQREAEGLDCSAARRWLHDNNPHLRSGSHPADLPYSTRSFSSDPDLTDFPMFRIHGGTPDDDGGLIAYNSQFERVRNADIVVCTHAMVGIDIRIRGRRMMNGLLGGRTIEELRRDHAKTEDEISFADWLNEECQRHDEPFKLPEYRHLIVDEGHSFEKSVASVMSDDLSLRGLLSADLPASARLTVERSLRTLGSLIPGEVSEDINLAENELAAQAIDDIHKALIKVRKKSTEISAAVKMIAFALKNMGRAGFSCQITFSPIRRYPRLRTGLTSVHFILRHLWASLQSAALISGTMFLPSRTGNSSTHIQICLSIPKGRSSEKMFAPPDWHTAPVEIRMPVIAPRQTGDGVWLTPPTVKSKDYAKRLDDWCDELAVVIECAYRQGDGGMLVLMTSYDTAHALSRKLHDAGLGDVLITADRETGTRLQKQRFIADSKTQRPIWVAVGASWTGLDMTKDCPPGEDDLLTDLVIPRCPFGSNQTATHAARRNRFGWLFEVNETVLFLRQGIGRLVRRAGIKRNRKLWLLDARIQTMNLPEVRALLTHYRVKQLLQHKGKL